MKIAVQLFGHMRTFRDCAPYLKKHLLELYDCDVFIHTWEYENHNDSTWHSNARGVTANKTDEELLCELYFPTSYLIEPSKSFLMNGVYGSDANSSVSLKGIQSMLYSVFKVNQLRLVYQEQTQQQYDYVVVLRPDVLLLEPLEINSFSDMFAFSENVSIHFPLQYKDICMDRRFLSIPYASDLFYFSKPEIINVIANLYKHFERYYVDIKCILPKGMNVPEFSFKTYCTHSSVVSYYYKQYFIVKRSDNQNNLCPKTLSLTELDRFGIEVPHYLIPKKKTYKKIREVVRYCIYKFKCFSKRK